MNPAITRLPRLVVDNFFGAAAPLPEWRKPPAAPPTWSPNQDEDADPNARDQPPWYDPHQK